MKLPHFILFGCEVDGGKEKEKEEEINHSGKVISFENVILTTFQWPPQ